MEHIVLLGDSIFDNESYVPGGEPVIEQLRACIRPGGRASLLAVDGSVISDVAKQLARLPEDPTRLVVSVGGNDALGHSGILDDAALSAADVFASLARIQREFIRAYREMLQAVAAARTPTVICTIYDSVPGLQQEALAALSVFNDAIIRAGVEHGLPILDLRFVCDEPRDYSSLSPIEPSETGGMKIVKAIVRVVRSHDFDRGETMIYR